MAEAVGTNLDRGSREAAMGGRAQSSRARLGIALLAAVCLGMASPPAFFAGAEILVVVGLVLLCGLATSGRRAALFVGLAYGLQLAWASVSLRFLSLPGFLAIPPFAALYAAIVTWVLGLALRGRSRAWLPPLFACAITVLEFWRAQMPGMEYPHIQVSHAFYRWPGLIGAVRFVGEPGMNFLFALLAGSLWLLVAARRSENHAPGATWVVRDASGSRGTRAGSVGVLAALALIAGLGLLPCRTIKDGEALRVAVVQTGVQAFPDQPRYKLSTSTRLRLTHYAGLADRIPDCDLVIWPESAISGSVVGKDARAHAAALRFFQGRAKRVVYGTTRIPADIAEQIRRAREGNGERPRFLKHFNSVYYGSADQLLGIHDKTRLVPGGETLPPWFAWLRSIDSRIPNLSRGKEAAIFELADGRSFGPAVCFENAFADHFADQALRGASFFAVLSFESWYRLGVELDQMEALSVFRALETGREIVRSTSDGWTLHLGADGQVLARLALDEPGILETEVQPRAGERPALRWGSRVPWIALVGLLGLALFGFATSRRSSGQAAG